MNKEFGESDWDAAIDSFDAHEDRNSPLWMQQSSPEARGEREAFHLSHPWSSFRERLTQKAERSRLGRRLKLNLWVSGLGLAASCAVVLMLVAPQVTETALNQSVESGIREKGAVSGLNPIIQVSPPVLRVHRGEQALSNGALLKPENQIKFSVDTMDYDHLFIFGIEENGTLTAYYPEAGRSLMVGQSNGLMLPDFVELDRQQGHERFVALFSKQALSWIVIKSLAQQKWIESGKNLKNMAALGLGKTEEAAFWFVKQSLP